MQAGEARQVGAAVDLDAADQRLPAQAPHLQPAGVVGVDAVADAGQEDVVELDPAQAIQHLEDRAIGRGRPAGGDGGLHLLHAQVPHRAAAAGEAAEGEGDEALGVDLQPGALAAALAFGIAHALQPDRRIGDGDGGGQAIGPRAQLQRPAALGLQVGDGGLDGRRVVGRAIAHRAVVAHMRAPIRQDGAAQLGHRRAAGFQRRAAAGLHKRRKVAVGRGDRGRQLADPCIRHWR